MHFVLCQCLVAESNVAFHRVGKEENVLRRRADAIAQLLQLPLAHVAAVNGNAAAGHVVAAGEQLNQRRFAGTGRPHDGDGLPRLGGERYVGQHRL